MVGALATVYHSCMQLEDFDVASLAAYLHLDPQQIERLANRGKIPARKVGGKWRFSPAEIHHWMERRLGLLDDDQLAQVEGAMSPQDTEATEDLSVRALLPMETIAVPLEAKTKNSVIVAMCGLAANSGLLWDVDRMTEAVRSREDLQSTAMDNGVALLHPRRPIASILGAPVMALGKTSRGIPFGGGRTLTDIFWLTCSVDDRSHLRALARISRLIADEDMLSAMRASEGPAAMLAVLSDAEAGLDS